MLDIPALDSFPDVFGDRDRAATAAVGIWADDPANPGVIAIVSQGKLQELVIPDSYIRLAPQALSDLINAVVTNAYLDWNAARQRLLAPKREH
jgi:hypothetical protein